MGVSRQTLSICWTTARAEFVSHCAGRAQQLTGETGLATLVQRSTPPVKRACLERPGAQRPILGQGSCEELVRFGVVSLERAQAGAQTIDGTEHVSARGHHRDLALVV